MSRWIWNPLARLTFGAYLVHPILMDLVYSTSRIVEYLDGPFITVHYSYFLVAAYLCSAGQFMLVERPIMSMTGLLKAKLGGKRKSKQPTESTNESKDSKLSSQP